MDYERYSSRSDSFSGLHVVLPEVSYRPVQADKATDVTILTAATLQQPLYWLALVMVLGSSILCARLLSNFT